MFRRSIICAEKPWIGAMNMRFSFGSSEWWVAMICVLGLDAGLRTVSACTTIAVGKNASADGSTMCTHNADCLDCDFRLGRVPARDWPPGSERPIVKFRAQYPRTVSKDRGDTWTPDNLDDELPQRDHWMAKSWREDMVLGHIPQVNHTFAYLEGLYAIINEKQARYITQILRTVGIGESTCGAIWFAGPLSDDCPQCNAMFDISELSRVALERASTAREAIQIMGDLAVKYGFYGSEWDAMDPFTYNEAAEALVVTDPEEAWVFHILSDDTSTSAIWAAQRVPDDHVTVVANQFIIKEISPDADPEYFMFSKNLFEVAEHGGTGYKRGSGIPLHFTKAFFRRPSDAPHFAYSTRRMWRVFDIFAPSFGLSPYTDRIARDYPFSVRPDEQVSVQDVIRVVRDHYEGTPFDLSKGLSSGDILFTRFSLHFPSLGPYGDVDRYDPGASLDGSTTLQEAWEGGFYERSISLFRTSYSSVTQSRAHLPDEVGALVWVAQYKPSMSTFIPLYVNMLEVPHPYTIGSLLRFTKEASYWAFSVVGNWAERYRVFAIEDVVAQQLALEDPLFKAQVVLLEQLAASLIPKNKLEAVTGMLTEHSNAAASTAVSSYHALFDTLVARFHDGYYMKDPSAETVEMNKLFYPKWWLEAVGYFSTRQVSVDRAASSLTASKAVDANSSDAIEASTYNGMGGTLPRSLPVGRWESTVYMMVGALFFVVSGVVIGRWSATRSGYVNLSEAVI
ncbi:unnamed protein product [Ascophyllum nodosum]